MAIVGGLQLACGAGSSTRYQKNGIPGPFDLSGVTSPVPQAQWAGPERKTGGVGATNAPVVSVFGGAVAYARPESWVVRRYSRAQGSQFVEYISPLGLLVVLSERPERGEQPWGHIVGNLQRELAAAGYESNRRAVPTVVSEYQARVLSSRRVQRRPDDQLSTFTQDYLVRSRKRVVLLQFSCESGFEHQAAQEARVLLSSLDLSGP